MTIKKMRLVLFSLCSAPFIFNAQAEDTEVWHDLSDPHAVYSSVSVAGGNEGVNISASSGGYLNGQFKHKITLESMNDLDYYNADYMIVDSSHNSGFAIETSWGEDLWDVDDTNNTAVAIFSKIPLQGEQLHLYPKLNLGLLWGDDINSTTYITFDLTTRYNISDILWVGITPTYTYGMQGYDLREWNTSIDAGVQLSGDFAFAAHFDDDYDFWLSVIFTF